MRRCEINRVIYVLRSFIILLLSLKAKDEERDLLVDNMIILNSTLKRQEMRG
jgi:hypothetical protein